MTLPKHVQSLLSESNLEREQEDQLEEDESQEEETQEEETQDEDQLDDSEEDSDSSEDGEEEESEEEDDDWKTRYEESERAKNGILANLAGMRQEGRQLKDVITRMQQDFEALKTSDETENLPNIEEDPVGHLNAKMDYVLEQVQGQGATAQQQQALDKYSQQVKQVAQTTTNLENEFRKKNPDYDEAYNRLQNIFHQGFLAQGATQEQANALVGNLALRFSVDALNRGVNPAEEAYKIALEYGHVPPQDKKKKKKKSSKDRNKIPDEVKKGTKMPNLGAMGKNSNKVTRSKGTVVTSDEFWNRWEAHERLPYLSDPDFFEEIMTQGQAVLPE